MKKSLYFLLICVVLLASLLAGCGKAPANDTPAEPPAAPTAEALPTEAPTAAPSEDPGAAALSAYRDILAAAPALEGEHEELSDASFGYEQNREKFGEHLDRFALTDLNADGVPELIALSFVNFRWTPVSVYTYADGAAVLLKDPLDPECPATFAQNSSANGAYSLYICASGHIHSVWSGSTPVGDMTEDHAYALEGTALLPVECAAGETGSAVYFSDIAKANTAENRDGMMR